MLSFFALYASARTVPDPCQWQGLNECRDRALVCQGSSNDALTANNWPVSEDGQPDKIVSAFGPRNRGARRVRLPRVHRYPHVEQRRSRQDSRLRLMESESREHQRPCWDEGGPDCADLLHSLVLRHPCPNDVYNDEDDFFSTYVHFDPWMPWDGVSDPSLLPYWPYRDLYVGKDVELSVFGARGGAAATGWWESRKGSFVENTVASSAETNGGSKGFPVTKSSNTTRSSGFGLHEELCVSELLGNFYGPPGRPQARWSCRTRTPCETQPPQYTCLCRPL